MGVLDGGWGALWFVFTCDLVKSLLAMFEWALDTGSSSSFCRFLFIIIDQLHFFVQRNLRFMRGSGIQRNVQVEKCRMLHSLKLSILGHLLLFFSPCLFCLFFIF